MGWWGFSCSRSATKGKNQITPSYGPTAGRPDNLLRFYEDCAALCGFRGVLILGQAFESPPPGRRCANSAVTIAGRSFFAPGLGWLPVDASCACKYGKHRAIR